MGFLKKEPSIDDLEQQTEVADKEVDLAERKMLLAKLKQMHGDGSKGLFKGMKSGMDWDSLKFRIGDTSRLKGKF